MAVRTPLADTGRAAGRRTLLVQVGAFILVLGVPDGALGVLWPSMRATFHLPLDDLGALTIAGTALYFCGGLLASRVQARLGIGNAIVACCLLALASLAAWAAATAWLIVLGALAFLGLSKGVIDAVVNAEAALGGGVRRLGLLHGSWAIGGTLGPLLVAAVLAWAHDWRAAVVVMAAGVLVLMPLSLRGRHFAPAAPLPSTPWPASPAPASPAPAAASAPVASAPVASPATPSPAVAPTAVDSAASPSLPMPSGSGPPAPAAQQTAGGVAATVASSRRWGPPLLLTVTVFAVYAAAENGPIAWGYSYLILDRHVSRALAAVALALFWAGLTAGRFALAVVDDRFDGTVVLESSCLLLIAGTGLLWVLPGSSAVIGLPIAGLGASAVFPVLVALMPRRVGQAGTGHAVGASIAAACFGGPVAVALFGLLAAHFGVAALGLCLFAAAVLLGVVNRVLTVASGRWAT